MREEWRREREDQMKEIDKMKRAWRKNREEMRKKMEETKQKLIEAIGVKGMSRSGEMEEGERKRNMEERKERREREKEVGDKIEEGAEMEKRTE